MVCLWWDIENVAYYEVLKQGETLNAEMYCHEHWEIITEHRPSSFPCNDEWLLHDNTRTHIDRHSGNV